MLYTILYTLVNALGVVVVVVVNFGSTSGNVVIAPISLTEAHLSKGSLILIPGEIDTAVDVPVTERKVDVREQICQSLLTSVPGNQPRLHPFRDCPFLDNPTADCPISFAHDRMVLHVCLVSAHSNTFNWLLVVSFISLPVSNLVATVVAHLHGSLSKDPSNQDAKQKKSFLKVHPSSKASQRVLGS